ncbi:MAG: type I restriction enzyme HsdR N-terminal domain-containing protein [Bacteroidia bacterium]|jgi:hypothetical protein
MNNNGTGPPSLVFREVVLLKRWHQGQEQVWDAFRRRWLVFGPEEWVRQQLAHDLVQRLGYPKSRLVIEKRVSQGDGAPRLDLLVLSKNGEPLVLVECKAPHVPLNEEVWWQVLGYGTRIPAPVVAVTNGYSLQVRQWTTQGWVPRTELPSATAWVQKPLTGQ